MLSDIDATVFENVSPVKNRHCKDTYNFIHNHLKLETKYPSVGGEGKWSESESFSVVSNSLRPLGIYSPWNSPGQNTGVGSLSLLQGIFPTQRLNSGLPHCRWILYQLNHKGSPRILEWVVYPFSSRSSQPRNQTRVSCIAGGFFTNWPIREEVNNGILTIELMNYQSIQKK